MVVDDDAWRVDDAACGDDGGPCTWTTDGAALAAASAELIGNVGNEHAPMSARRIRALASPGWGRLVVGSLVVSSWSLVVVPGNHQRTTNQPGGGPYAPLRRFLLKKSIVRCHDSFGRRLVVARRRVVVEAVIGAGVDELLVAACRSP